MLKDNAGARLQVSRAIWLYFILLMTEGMLRKWVVPSLSGPLLLIRDPVVIWAYLVAYRGNLFPQSTGVMIVWLSGMSGLFSLMASFSADMSNPLVTLYGLRTNFLHVPLIFLMGSVLDETDVRRFGYWTLMISPIMAVLMVAQFRATPDDFLNLGAGGGRQIQAVQGRIRPAGTFSFVNGVIAYFSMVTAYFLDGLLRRDRYPVVLIAFAAFSVLSALSVSGSRSIVIAIGIVGLAAIVGVLLAPWLMERLFRILAVAGIAVAIATTTQFFGEGIDSLILRFKLGGGSEGITSRLVSFFLPPLHALAVVPVFGFGCGMGTMAGAAILTGENNFLLAEDEWARLIMESGPFLGPILIFLRIGLFLWLAQVSVLQARNRGNVLPLLMFGAVGINILIGQWGQTTTQGFTSFTAGLCLAACNLREDDTPPASVKQK